MREHDDLELDFASDELGDAWEAELGGADALALARQVVAAVIRGGNVRDVSRLTNLAFHIHHPDRKLEQPLDPQREPALATLWSRLKREVVEPSLAAPAGATPGSSTGTGTSMNGARVLLVGDSHTEGPFGLELARLLQLAGATVVRQAKRGTAVKYWLPLLPGLIQSHRPTHVIVGLGANMRDYPSATGTTAQFRQMVAAIRKLAPAARLIWIGPPRKDKDSEATLQRFNAIIRAGLDAPTRFVDSAPLTPVYRGGDGEHYETATAKAWARGVADAITR
jgi:hypothetical protein